MSSAPWIIESDDLEFPDGDACKAGRIARGLWRGNMVAVKVLTKQAEGSALTERGSLWSSLQHGNILQTLGVSPADADPLFVVTPYHSSGNVMQHLERNPGADRMQLVLDAALGMQYLHTCGVVHGSLKPSNILVKQSGRACIADYGMVEVQSSASHGHRYFSPEAWKGTLSRPSDVYAWAMSALEILTSKAPWGILTEKQIFRLVVQQNMTPDRPDEDLDLTDNVWELLEDCWRASRLRPTFDALVQRLHAGSEQEITIPPSFDNANGLAPPKANRTRYTVSMMSGPPAYDAPSSTAVHPGSAPPTVTHFQPPPKKNLVPQRLTPMNRGSTSDLNSSFDSEEGGTSAGTSPPRTPRSELGLMPSPSVRTSSSVGSSSSRHFPANRMTNITPIGEDPGESAGFRKHSYVESTFSSGPRHRENLSPFPSGSVYAESVQSGQSSGTAPNANLIAGALSTEVKEGRKRDVVDGYLGKMIALSLGSSKDAHKLVTAGVIPTLIVLLKTRAADGIGLELVLLALGFLIHDPITANAVHRTDTSKTLIDILNAAQLDDIGALTIWCLIRVARTPEVVASLLKHNLGSSLVRKGLRGGQRTSRMAGWCLGAIVRSDAIADTLCEMGIVSAVCEHMRRCRSSVNADAADHSAILYAVARLSRSIKIAKQLSKGGCVDALAYFLETAEDPQVLQWSVRAVGCLMRPNSGDMAKTLLDAGIASGLARLPSILPADQIEPLGAFAFAVQRFSCAEWGGGTRKALVEAGAVDALLAALRTAAEEPFPQVHIELAHAIALLADVGGSAIRKEIVSAGGVGILKQIASDTTTRADVAKACNLAATSVMGNLWSRNAASAKAALVHEWSGGCPDHIPECPIPMNEIEAW
ncbi:unnamed protein product [Mycena citricolor]|uniref:Protein kinase domain-containing protein n=1 Tax=Mycena citricolor TaxID=2018698 RepID=A0AAD2Q0S3_9AGAR|nr:unnamed protein product [Mycena citricolor]CAK5263589.1 unnamed protein product [Mycena citricolor]